MEQIVSIPEDRIGFLVGKEGDVKQQIEKSCHVRLTIKGSVVNVKGESLDVMKAASVVRAIGLGFAKEGAFELFNDELQLTVFNVLDVLPASQLPRFMARVIGEKGKAKRHFEEKLQLNIVVSDEKIAAIGDPMNLRVFREVLDRMLGGATHSAAYKHLDRRMADLH